MSGASKGMVGCGGCGCLLALVGLVAGGVMIGLMNDSHMSEAGPVGMIVAPAAAVLGVLSLVLLIVGFVLGRRGNDDED